jgi:galactose mutarotase-like enzyme
VDELPTGELQDVSGKYDLRWPTRIGRNNYDDVFTDLRFQLEGDSKQVVSQLYDPACNALIEVGASEEFKNMVLFVPADRPQLICLEPQTSATDAFNLRQNPEANLITLEPNRPFTASVWVRVTEATPPGLADV